MSSPSGKTFPCFRAILRRCCCCSCLSMPLFQETRLRGRGSPSGFSMSEGRTFPSFCAMLRRCSSCICLSFPLFQGIRPVPALKPGGLRGLSSPSGPLTNEGIILPRFQAGLPGRPPGFCLAPTGTLLWSGSSCPLSQTTLPLPFEGSPGRGVVSGGDKADVAPSLP